MRDRFEKMSDGERLKEIQKILKEAKVKSYVKKHNKKQIFEEDEFVTPRVDGAGVPFEDEIYFLMKDLGVPIGCVQVIDSKGKILNEYSEYPTDGIIRYLYLPINNMRDYVKYYKKYDDVDLMVNPTYMESDKICHLAYCLDQANNEMIFDKRTMNKMQIELVCSAPLKYDEAMAIFNKYFTKRIQALFIYKYKVEIDRFYKLSGLNQLIYPKKTKNKGRSR